VVCRHVSDKLGCAAGEKRVAEHCYIYIADIRNRVGTVKWICNRRQNDFQ
jgi:hypothetical protein